MRGIFGFIGLGAVALTGCFDTQLSGGQNLLFSQATGGCLSVDMAERSGANDSGYNVVAATDCTGSAGQNWKWFGRQLSTEINGQTFCLDINYQDLQGDNDVGRNVIAGICTDDWNQKWTRAENGTISNIELGDPMCLDVSGSDSKPLKSQVIVWPQCHGGPNQVWQKVGANPS